MRFWDLLNKMIRGRKTFVCFVVACCCQCQTGNFKKTFRLLYSNGAAFFQFRLIKKANAKVSLSMLRKNRKSMTPIY